MTCQRPFPSFPLGSVNPHLALRKVWRLSLDDKEDELAVVDRSICTAVLSGTTTKATLLSLCRTQSSLLWRVHQDLPKRDPLGVSVCLFCDDFYPQVCLLAMTTRVPVLVPSRRDPGATSSVPSLLLCMFPPPTLTKTYKFNPWFCFTVLLI